MGFQGTNIEIEHFEQFYKVKKAKFESKQYPINAKSYSFEVKGNYFYLFITVCTYYFARIRFLLELLSCSPEENLSKPFQVGTHLLSYMSEAVSKRKCNYAGRELIVVCPENLNECFLCETKCSDSG